MTPAEQNDVGELLGCAKRLLEETKIAQADLEELKALRLRVKAQRKELRRLNKTLGPYWAGFRRGLYVDDACRLRAKMIAAFGPEAVREAEHRGDVK